MKLHNPEPRAPFADPFDPVEMSTLFPTLANGHLGFTVFGDAVYMDGLFNGHRGLSHRARIANVANLRLQLEEEGTSAAGNLTSSRDGFRMDFRTGTFCVDYRGPNNSFRVTQRIYPHQSFDRAIVNQFEIMRLDGDGDLNIVLSQPYTFPGSEDIVFTPTETETVFADQSNDDEDVADDQQDGTGAHEPERRRRPLFSNPNRWAIKQSGPAGRNKYSSAEPSHHHQQQQQQQRPAWVLHRSCGHTLEPEIPEESRPGPQQLRQVCVLWNHVPEELTLERSEQSVSYRFIMTVDESAKVARDELLQALRMDDEEFLRLHTYVWESFWSKFDIQIDDNPELQSTVRASIFYLMSNFNLTGNEAALGPASTTGFGGSLSPTGLGRGGSNRDDYEGHSFWDTEIWMFPVVNLIDSRFSEALIDYRFQRLDSAKKHAESGGFRGARFPWESAVSGMEVTQPEYPEVANFQQHITADISYALRQYFAATHDLSWLNTKGCFLAAEIAKFWASRLSHDPVTDLYDIKAVMGPDEDHETVTNNAYTNVAAAYALYFGDLTKCMCGKKSKNSTAPQLDEMTPQSWSSLAGRLKLLYDSTHDYHPQFQGYELGTVIKQADTVLLGYPLNYQHLRMTPRTRSNDLRFYERVTRATGPAMTWAMHAINHLDLGEIEDAERNFERSYRSYVRAPFHVWCEVPPDQTGAVNFITGAGGFLQAIINGFAGVRLYLDRLEINRPRLLPGTQGLTIKGLEYLGARLTMCISKAMVTLEATQLTRDLMLHSGDKEEPISLNTIYDITNTNITIRNKLNVFGECSLPQDTLSIINV
ncbi:protein-glucosylgalactosylhydroxylysine glucosidase-like isoform X2 [Uranotaenia lowii]|uniref:protein-glucosylgalactosylhydroxylysine glucosidase-like isoform X2 n=1 Tax=Uranotaenia lowii TaxID=190385 RepID=UPI002478EFEF|nr:protein-glucosylgalactosylhydroxylysine glucosidase-like isoform X2 [Uranotaenia lowii]